MVVALPSLERELQRPETHSSTVWQTAIALASFCVVAMLGGSLGLQNWAERGDVEGWRGALAGPAAALATATAPLRLAEPHQWLTQATAGWIAQMAAAQDSSGGHFAALAEAAEQANAAGDSPAGSQKAPAQAPDQLAGAAPVRSGPAAPAASGSDGAATGAGQPSTDSPAQSDSSPAEPAGPAPILLAGDSLMAVGLAPGLMQGTTGASEFKLLRGYRSATGLSRPDYFDWPKALDRLLTKHHPRCVVVAMGGNDAQGFRQDKKVLHFGTPAWDEAYRGRVEALLTISRKHGAPLLWLSAPKMRSSAFSTSMARLNRLVLEAIAKVKGSAYLDLNPFITDAKGEFAAYLDDAKGRPQRIRTEDGVHLTDVAGRRLAAAVDRWIRGHCLKKS